MGLVFENKNNNGSLRLIDVNNNGGFSVIFSSLTPTPNISPTITPSISVTSTPSISVTPSVTSTPSISVLAASVTPTVSITPSVTPTISRTPSVTPTVTRTITPTPSVTRTVTPTVSVTRTITPTPSITPSITPSVTPIGEILYSNFDVYIVDGVRQASTADLIRSNISTSRRLIVTETITIYGFKLVRIPPDNWTQTSYSFVPTLSVVSGTGATIDGGTTSKGFTNARVILNPKTVAERTGSTSQYDIFIMTPTGDASTTLTAGQYSLSVLGNSANMDIATLTTATFPIDTSKKIYPSGSATHFAMEVF